MGGAGGGSIQNTPKRRLVPRENADSVHAKKLHGKGTNKYINEQTDIATTRPNQPSGPILQKAISSHFQPFPASGFWSLRERCIVGDLVGGGSMAVAFAISGR